MDLPFLLFQKSYYSPCHCKALKRSEVFTEKLPNNCMQGTEIFFNVVKKLLGFQAAAA